MPNSRPDLMGLVLDEFGRVVLSDDLLGAIDVEPGLSAGGDGVANIDCLGSANTYCTNAHCSGSTNEECSNTFSCFQTSNYHLCKEPWEVPE